MAFYIYTKSEPRLWTVGFYHPKDGRWEPESDHSSEKAAADRVHWLNGGHVADRAAADTKLIQCNAILRDALVAIVVEIPHSDGKLWAYRIQGWAREALAKVKE